MKGPPVSNPRRAPERLEIRTAAVSWPKSPAVEIRTTGRTFHGYAAVFDSDSEPLPFIERIRPGAFAKTLRENRNIRMFVNHDPGRVLASLASGTLRLAEDRIGLRVEADLPDTSEGRDLAELLRTTVVDSMSFGFQVPPNGDEWNRDGSRRELIEVRLHEVSPVTSWPAYPATSAGVRNLPARLTAEALRVYTDVPGAFTLADLRHLHPADLGAWWAARFPAITHGPTGRGSRAERPR